MEDLGFEAREEAQRLRVAFEPADVLGDAGERRLAVVSERRVTEVVRETGAVDHVGVASEKFADLTADLGDFERVGEARAREVVGAGDEDLAFRAEST